MIHRLRRALSNAKNRGGSELPMVTEIAGDCRVLKCYSRSCGTHSDFKVHAEKPPLRSILLRYREDFEFQSVMHGIFGKQRISSDGT